MKAATWTCGNRGCTHRTSKRWHRIMVERIEEALGPRGAQDFEAAHPDPDLIPCDDCGLVGRHDLTVEH